MSILRGLIFWGFGAAAAWMFLYGMSRRERKRATRAGGRVIVAAAIGLVFAVVMYLGNFISGV